MVAVVRLMSSEEVIKKAEGTWDWMLSSDDEVLKKKISNIRKRLMKLEPSVKEYQARMDGFI